MNDDRPLTDHVTMWCLQGDFRDMFVGGSAWKHSDYDLAYNVLRAMAIDLKLLSQLFF